MMYELILEDEVLDSSRKLPQKVQIKFARKVLALRDDPRPPGCKKLSGFLKDLWRV